MGSLLIRLFNTQKSCPRPILQMIIIQKFRHLRKSSSFYSLMIYLPTKTVLSFSDDCTAHCCSVFCCAYWRAKSNNEREQFVCSVALNTSLWDSKHRVAFNVSKTHILPVCLQCQPFVLDLFDRTDLGQTETYFIPGL